MSVFEISAPKRLSVTLDPGLVLERLILRRLGDLQRKRSQDWLRSLLVQGFLAEGHWLRSGEPGGRKGLVPQESAIPTTPFGRWLERSHATNSTPGEPERCSADAPVAAPEATTGAKPFAYLRKVIG